MMCIQRYSYIYVRRLCRILRLFQTLVLYALIWTATKT
jgi:hypothetical protein